jgi:hypothetical protein
MPQRKWSAEDLKTYKRWLVAMAVFYTILGAMVVLAVAWESMSRTGPTLEAKQILYRQDEPVRNLTWPHSQWS